MRAKKQNLALQHISKLCCYLLKASECIPFTPNTSLPLPSPSPRKKYALTEELIALVSFEKLIKKTTVKQFTLGAPLF